jgi:hypothetical protein
VAEWLKAPHSKCGILARVSRVRIPPSPPGPAKNISHSNPLLARAISAHKFPRSACQHTPGRLLPALLFVFSGAPAPRFKISVRSRGWIAPGWVQGQRFTAASYFSGSPNQSKANVTCVNLSGLGERGERWRSNDPAFNVHRPALVGEARIARDHKQPAETRQANNDFLNHPVGKVILLLVNPLQACIRTQRLAWAFFEWSRVVGG